MQDKDLILKKFNDFTKDTLMETLKIRYIDVGEDYLVATMPVNKRVHQPKGILHGGATVALAESVGSAASYLYIDRETQDIRGVEIAANHIRSLSQGQITAKAVLIHKGRTTHFWTINITDKQERLICVCKLTNIILNKY